MYDETVLGKEFVERYGYTYPARPFDSGVHYADDAPLPDVCEDLAPGEATPHSLTEAGVVSLEDWCDFLQERRYAVLNAGPLILPLKDMDRWTRRVRKLLPPKKFGRSKRRRFR